VSMQLPLRASLLRLMAQATHLEGSAVFGLEEAEMNSRTRLDPVGVSCQMPEVVGDRMRLIPQALAPSEQLPPAKRRRHCVEHPRHSVR